MARIYFLTILSVLVNSALMVQAQTPTCPPVPDLDVNFGGPVPIKPENIPPGCSDFEILVARGTSEPDYALGGKFGVVVGDPLVSNLTRIMPNARGYPVQYPASSDVISGGIQGRRDIYNRIISQSYRCPTQKFALVGYSQGASIMHQAVGELPTSVYPKILSIVMFGDPNLRLGILGDRFPVALRSKVLQNCAKGDLVCDSGNCQYWHLTYIRPEWINRSVNFIVNAFRGTPLPPSTTVGL